MLRSLVQTVVDQIGSSDRATGIDDLPIFNAGCCEVELFAPGIVELQVQAV